jgi:hypothetical protein
MLDMQAFHKRLSVGSYNQNGYFKALTAVTKASADQMKAISTDMSWQNWGTDGTPVEKRS